MERRIITVLDELEISNKQRILVGKKDQELLLDKENPYYSIRSREKPMSLFVLWEKIHYGILTSNILSVIEDKLGSFIGSIFKEIKGIIDDEFNENYFIHLLGNNGKKDWKRIKKEIGEGKKEGDVLHVPNPASVYINTMREDVEELSAVSRAVSGCTTCTSCQAGEVVEADLSPDYYGAATTHWNGSTAPQQATIQEVTAAEQVAASEQRVGAERQIREYVETMRRQENLSRREMEELYVRERRSVGL